MKTLKSIKQIALFEGEEYASTEENYDEQGRLIETKDFEKQVLISYNEQGLVSTEVIHYTHEQNTSETLTYTYDENGDLVQAVNEYSGGGKIITNYSRTSKIEEATSVDEAGNQETRQVTAFDERKSPVQVLIYDEENTLVEQIDCTYDEHGLLIREKTTNHDLEFFEIEENSYNQQQQLIANKFTADDGSVYTDQRYSYETPEENTLVLKRYQNTTNEHSCDPLNQEVLTDEATDETFHLVEIVKTKSDSDNRPLKVEVQSTSSISFLPPGATSGKVEFQYTFWED